MVGLFEDLGHLGVRDEAFALTVSQLIVRQMSDRNVVLQAILRCGIRGVI